MMDQAARLRQMVEAENKMVSSRVIAVTSGKGGVGKTSFSVNLAIKLAETGKRVVIFDADFGLANVEIMLGIRPRFTLADTIYNGKKINEVIMNGPKGIGFISGGSGIADLAALDNEKIRILINHLVQLDSMYDIVIIDTGAGITDSVMEFLMVSPEILLVVTPEPTSITDAYSLLKVLRRKSNFNPATKTISVIANRVTEPLEGKEIFGKINTVSSRFLNTKLKYLGFVSQDKAASISIIEQVPVVMSYPNSLVARDISKLAEKIANETIEEKKSNGIAKVFLDFIKSRRNNSKR